MIIQGLIALAVVSAAPPVPVDTSVSADGAAEHASARHAGEASPSLIGDALLRQARAGETIIINDQSLRGVVNGNVIGDNYTAGSVTISDQALSNFNGLGNLLINTGAQNSLQAGMSVTINLHP